MRIVLKTGPLYNRLEELFVTRTGEDRGIAPLALRGVRVKSLSCGTRLSSRDLPRPPVTRPPSNLRMCAQQRATAGFRLDYISTVPRGQKAWQTPGYAPRPAIGCGEERGARAEHSARCRKA